MGRRSLRARSNEDFVAGGKRMREEKGNGRTEKTVQEYIDETPFWADGTKTRSAPLTRMQWRIWWLASAGKFFEGLAVFMTGVALPLIVSEFSLGATEKGMVGAAPLFGILIGASVLGDLSDRFGRKRMFIVEMALFTFFLICLALSPNYPSLLVFLFGLGLALGCDYPTAHMILSETIPSRDRGRLILSAFGFQALGAMAGAALGYLALYENPDIGAWRFMYGAAVLPALMVLYGRFHIPDSPAWLAARRRIKEAERQTEILLDREPTYPASVTLAYRDSKVKREEKGRMRQLFSRKNRRAAILASVPWFLQDLGTYGIGIFTPTILASVLGQNIEHARNLADLIRSDMLAAKGAAFIDVLLIVGIAAAALLVDRIGRIRLQILGFIGCAAGLFLASLSMNAQGGMRMIYLFSGFMLFNFMTNLGPNAMTYLISGEVFPVHIRGLGAGFAASFAKVGAVVTAFFFPILLKDIGAQTLLYILMGASLIGAAVTFAFRIETRGLNLERLGEGDGE
jgi:MFS transporter, putative metabolite transport protein